MNGKRVLALGWYGAGNLGDELLLDTLKRWCAEQGADVAAISIDPGHTRSVHGIEAVDFHDLRGVAQAIGAADLFVLGGGGLFQTHQDFTIPGLYDYTTPDVAVYARPVLMAQQMGVPTMAWAQGLGPLDGEQAKEIIRDLFERVDHLSVRDAESQRLLREVGVQRQVLVAPDPIWACPLPSASQTTDGSLRVGVVLRGWAFVPGWEDRFVAALKAAIGPRDATLVWLPFQCHAVPGRSGSDLDFIRSLMLRIGAEYRHELVTSASLSEPLDALAGCHAVVAMRLHAQILALRFGKPTLCIEYDSKMVAASAQAGLPAGCRIAIDAPAETWLGTMATWWSAVKSGAAPRVSTAELQDAALGHKQLLHSALAVEPRSRKWRSAGFNWLGAWQQKSYDAALAQRDQVLLQLNENLADAQSRNTALVEQVNAIVSELRGVIEAQGERMSQMEEQATQAQRTHEVALANANQLVNQRSAEVVTLNQQLVSLNQSLLDEREISERKQHEIDGLRTSTSWRITRPLRVVRYFLRDPAFALREARKLLFAKAVPDKKPIEVAVAPSVTERRDLNWEEFRSAVLHKRDDYKGVFIQEAVIDWDVPLYQRPQHLASAFARRGYLVIYRTHNWGGDDVEGFREVTKNVWLTNRAEVDGLEGAVRSVYSTAYANAPDDLKARSRNNVLVYEYIDHIDPRISGEAQNIRRLIDLRDWAFGGGADFVVASARQLELEACAAVGRDKVVLAQNGVDTSHYRNRAHSLVELPDHLREFRARYTNIVGYFGAIAPWLWYDALKSLIAARPDLGFVFIGPDYYGGVERLPVADNVLYLGTVDYKILPAYARCFDVCFIPFEPGDIARTTSPLKLFEYFALEKPVVVTSDMLECTVYPEVFSGDSADALSQAIDRAISVKSDAAFKSRLALLADENNWDSRVRSMEMVFSALPEKRFSAIGANP